MPTNEPTLENPADGVTVLPDGRQRVSWEGVTPESDDPALDGHTDGGIPVGH